MRGRKPKPTAIKQLLGNPGKRPLNDREPRPRIVLPRCPSHLDKTGKLAWRRLARELYASGLLSIVDRDMLAAYCVAYSRWVKAERILQRTGEIIKTSNGNPIQNPYLAVANRAIEQMMKLAAEFGMTPSARSRISVDAPDDSDDFMSLLFGTDVELADSRGVVERGDMSDDVGE